jgi:ketosteroid isomerase-like protein
MSTNEAKIRIIIQRVFQSIH